MAAGLDGVAALLLAALVNLGAVLAGPGVAVIEREPIPRALAFGFILLTVGLLAREMPLLAGLAGGIALVYDPAAAAPFWLAMLVALAADRRLRKLLRPCFTILMIFVLLLANLAQLQPGITDTSRIGEKISAAVAELQRWRTSEVWVSLWAGREMWHYLALAVCGAWATARIWPLLNRQLRWLFVLLPAFGILSVPLSDILLEHMRWALIPKLAPASALVYTVAMASAACGIAGAQAARMKKFWEASLWF
jgi:hypothetical protein